LPVVEREHQHQPGENLASILSFKVDRTRLPISRAHFAGHDVFAGHAVVLAVTCQRMAPTTCVPKRNRGAPLTQNMFSETLSLNNNTKHDFPARDL
jgi:hypothetical protein